MYTSTNAIQQEYTSLLWSISSSIHSFTLNLEVSTLDIRRLYTDNYSLNTLLASSKEVFNYRSKLEFFRKEISASIQNIDDPNYAQYFAVNALRLMEIINMVEFTVENIKNSIDELNKLKPQLNEEEYKKILEDSKNQNTDIFKDWIKNINDGINYMRQVLNPNEIDYTTFSKIKR